MSDDKKKTNEDAESKAEETKADGASKADEAKADKPKAEADKPKAEADKPKAEADKPKADEPKAEADKPKADAEADKPKADERKAEADKPKADAEADEPKADEPKAESDAESESDSESESESDAESESESESESDEAEEQVAARAALDEDDDGKPKRDGGARVEPLPGESTPDQLNRVATGQTDWRHSIGVVLMAVAIFVPQMGVYGMFDPWETHYTEVGRQFQVRNDWLSTYWHNGVGPDGWSERNFWSKPVGSFWMSGLSLKLYGYGAHTTGKQLTMGHPEWAVRTPFFLCALFGIFCIYIMCARLFSRRTGIFAAAILATAPMYFMIGRQAMTDMPYVGLMSGGLALFVLGVFGEREEMKRKSLKIGKWELSWPHSPTYYIFLFGFIGFMTLQLYAIIPPLRRVPLPLKFLGGKVSAAAVISLYAVIAGLLVFFSRKIKTRNEVYILGFYMVVGIAGLAKGLIGALQPGLVVLLYILGSREWRILQDVVLGRGVVVAICIFWPWYHGMVMRYGRSFWNELFGTEQLRRLTIGEQAQAKGTFEYYIKQIGYGLFPWIAFLPAALVRAFSLGLKRTRTAEERARLFICIWFLAGVVLFTITLTKYHHYILPAIPPGAILVALFLDDLIEKKLSAPRVALMIAGGVMAIVAFDIIKQPAHWVWMFTYLYTSNWARGVPKAILDGKLIMDSNYMIYTLSFSAAILGLLVLPKWRKQVAWVAVAIGVVIGGYTINWYLVTCAPHWSQKRVLQTYYKKRKSPEEKLIAWQFNWRGETWYTAASVVVSKSLNNKKIIEWLKKRTGRKFFFITERSRYGSLRAMLPTAKGKKTLHIVDDSNVHYVLAAADI
ncbi:MAG: glycosyltransferase family 39 protein [Myxococcales bacterium]|nr:glycosyltransferase family 39 protein [Myxococcales bacterium]